MATGTNSKKRFVDVHLWDQPWYIELSTKHQLFWHYMNAKCDNIGVYAHSERKTAFDIRSEINTSEIESTYKGQVKSLDDGKFLLVNFCKFQHCNSSPLLPKSKVFVSYMKDLRDSGLIDYFATHQTDVVSEETVIFFSAFREGILEFKYYSDNPSKALKSGCTPYQEALQKAKQNLNQSHTNDINMTLVSHQGKGTGNGAGKGVRTGMETEIGTPYSNSKEIAFRLNPNSDHSLVKQVQELASLLIDEIGTETPHSIIETCLTNLESQFPKSELTFDVLRRKVFETYLPEKAPF